MKKNGKKLLSLLLISATMLLAKTGDISAANNISLMIDGRSVYSDVAPYIKNSRTMVPLRVISENLGAEVNWDPNIRQAIVQMPSTGVNLVFPVNQYIYYKNGNSYNLDAPAEIASGRTMVPFRVIAEAFDRDVQWDSSTRSVIIGSGNSKNNVNNVANNAQNTQKINQVPKNADYKEYTAITGETIKGKFISNSDKFIEIMNEYRVSKGLSPVKHSKEMDEYAKVRCIETAIRLKKGLGLSHSRLDGSPEKFIGQGGENLAAGNTTEDAIFNQWKKSPGHNAHMLHNFSSNAGYGFATFEFEGDYGACSVLPSMYLDLNDMPKYTWDEYENGTVVTRTPGNNKKPSQAQPIQKPEQKQDTNQQKEQQQTENKAWYNELQSEKATSVYNQNVPYGGRMDVCGKDPRIYLRSDGTFDYEVHFRSDTYYNYAQDFFAKYKALSLDEKKRLYRQRDAEARRKAEELKQEEESFKKLEEQRKQEQQKQAETEKLAEQQKQAETQNTPSVSNNSTNSPYNVEENIAWYNELMQNKDNSYIYQKEPSSVGFLVYEGKLRIYLSSDGSLVRSLSSGAYTSEIIDEARSYDALPISQKKAIYNSLEETYKNK